MNTFTYWVARGKYTSIRREHEHDILAYLREHGYLFLDVNHTRRYLADYTDWFESPRKITIEYQDVLHLVDLIHKHDPEKEST